jgi:biotin carboxylase
VSENQPLTILCIAVALVGRPFMIEAKRLGHRVLVMTTAKRLNEAWPRDVVDDVFAVPDMFDETVVKNVVSYLARHQRIDRVVPMGDFDVDVAAMLREHLRLPGMGETTMRYFRDKLAMRLKTQEDGIPVPEFVHVLNYDAVNAYMDRVPAPWVLKPRMEAASFGIKKIAHRDELWPHLDKLGDKQSGYLLEKYTPGDVFHVDSVVSEREVVFASCSRYGTPMLDLNTTGGMFTTRMIERGSADEKALQKLNKQVVKSLGLVRGVTHIEYIKGREDGKFYFLEAGARVGAARIPDVVWHATDLCLWHEWAKIEIAQGKEPYVLPKVRQDYAGAIITLARQETPDLSAYTDPEIVYRQARKNHAGLIVRSSSQQRVEELLNQYAQRFSHDFAAHAPRVEA